MWTTDTLRLVHTSVFSGCIGASLSAVLWMGRIHQMLEALPLFKALSIPIVAFCVTASAVYGVFVIYSWLPGVRWGRAYADRCVTVAKRISATNTVDRVGTRDVIFEVERLRLELDRYQIPCPPLLERNFTSRLLWRNFLIIVGTRAKQNDLSRARKVFEDMTPDDRQDWTDLEKTLEEQYS